jgi:imidazolonepropionase-like amidohydrolase
VYDGLGREAYFAIINEAGRMSMPVEGHVPASIKAEEASEAGQKSIEHLTGLDEAKTDGAKAARLLAVFKKNRTWQCPTLIMRHNYAWLDDAGMARDIRLKYVKPSWRERWLNMTKEADKLPAAEWSKRKQMVRSEEVLVGKMQKAGVGILAGTDDANPYCFPGFSLHDELALLVDAGLRPMEALQAATLNPAKFLNKLGSLGAIKQGKLADLVLLDANPLEDIRSTSRIIAVVMDGRFLSRSALDDMLAEAESAAKNR